MHSLAHRSIPSFVVVALLSRDSEFFSIQVTSAAHSATRPRLGPRLHIALGDGLAELHHAPNTRPSPSGFPGIDDYRHERRTVERARRRAGGVRAAENVSTRGGRTSGYPLSSPRGFMSRVVKFNPCIRGAPSCIIIACGSLYNSSEVSAGIRYLDNFSYKFGVLTSPSSLGRFPETAHFLLMAKIEPFH